MRDRRNAKGDRPKVRPKGKVEWAKGKGVWARVSSYTCLLIHVEMKLICEVMAREDMKAFMT